MRDWLFLYINSFIDQLKKNASFIYISRHWMFSVNGSAEKYFIRLLQKLISFFIFKILFLF